MDVLTNETVDLRTQVHRMAQDVIRQDDLYLVDVVLRGQKGSRVIEVYVDGDDGVGLDQLAGISRELGSLLETEDVIKGRYHLNVSSPGPERDLVLLRQYERHVGKEIEMKVQADENTELLKGTLERVNREDIVIGKKAGPMTVPFMDILSARIILPW